MMETLDLIGKVLAIVALFVCIVAAIVMAVVIVWMIRDMVDKE